MTAHGDADRAFSRTELVEMQRRMLVIRGFEERVAGLYRDGLVPGFVHLSIGQEASAVGACWPLRPDDVITSTHRGHGHCLAKGLDPVGMFAELMGRDQGTNRGRGGSMHIADPTLGIFGANGIVAAGLPIAVGAATAAQLRDDGPVAVAFFGDGAAAQGAFHEALNLAAVWRLPVIFFCENNGYSEFSAAADQHAATLEAPCRRLRARPTWRVDGNDVVATASVMRGHRPGRPTGGGPALVEAPTYRWHGHYEGDPQRYRTPDEVRGVAASATRWRVHRDGFVAGGVGEAELDELGLRRGPRPRRGRRRGPRAWRPRRRHALRLRRPPAAGAPRAAAAARRVPRCSAPWTPSTTRSSPSWRRTNGSSSPASTSGAGGNVFGLTRGLRERFGDRVRDTPISETAIVGLGVGAAMAGMRPVVEVMYLDFLGVCLDQLLNQAAKLPFMTGGSAEMALTVRTQFGAGPLLGEPALAEPRGPAGAHPRADRRDAVDPGRHLRAAAGRDRGPEPGRRSSRTGCSTG